MTAPLRVLLDVNVWVANLLASNRGRHGTAAQKLVSMIASGTWGRDGREAQLVVSHEMLQTLDAVLVRLGATPDNVANYISAVEGIMRFGPEQLHPYLLLGGGREQFAMTDDEDARVLATAFASRASLLVTDNLKDFRTKESLRVETRVIKGTSGTRQLQALRHRRDGVDLIVAHPLDVVGWVEQRADFEPEALWSFISRDPASPS